MRKKKTLETFISESKALHGSKYNYRYIKEYINNHTKVLIECNACQNKFYQTPNIHLCGHGCPVCGRISKKTLEIFILESKKIHGKKYNYGHMKEYINSRTKVLIECNDCQSRFKQTPDCHLRGHGCKICGGTSKKTLETFILESEDTHGNKYNYGHIKEYINCKTKILIECNACKTKFEQTPAEHLNGSGCPKCNCNKGEQKIHKILEDLKIIFEKHKRILMGETKLELDVFFMKITQNLAIERDGEQHFKPKGFGCKDKEKIQKEFIKIQERDKRKNEWCKENKYHLLRISYKTKLEDYHNIIVEFLKESEQHKGHGYIKFDKFYDELLNPKKDIKEPEDRDDSQTQSNFDDYIDDDRLTYSNQEEDSNDCDYNDNSKQIQDSYDLDEDGEGLTYSNQEEDQSDCDYNIAENICEISDVDDDEYVFPEEEEEEDQNNRDDLYDERILNPHLEI